MEHFKLPKSERSLKEKQLFFYSFTIIGVLLVFLFQTLLRHLVDETLLHIELVCGLLMLVNVIYYYFSRAMLQAQIVTLLLQGIIIMSIYIQGGIDLTGMLWIMLYPLLVFALLDFSLGVYWLLVYSIILIVIELMMAFGVIASPYSAVMIRQTGIVYVVLVSLVVINELLKRNEMDKSDASKRSIMAILDNMQDIYYRTDNEGRVVLVSNSVQQVLGYSVHDVIGQYIGNFHVIEEGRSYILEKLSEGSGKIINLEITMRHANGEPITGLVNAQYYYDNEHNILGSEGTFKDVSKLYKAQNALKELNIKLEKRVTQEVAEKVEREAIMSQQNRLAGMGEMIGNIAHQWRQPLMTINGVLANIERAYEKGQLSQDFLSEKLDDVENITEHMSRTIDDFRNYFKPNKLMQPFSVLNSIDNVLRLMGNTLNGISIERHTEQDVMIKGYQNEFAQTLIAIINNARDILFTRDVEQKKITIALRVDENQVYIAISDNAGGIDAEVLPKIFDPYFTTKHQFGGTGLGLYICKMIIENSMNGRLSVMNNAFGATFEITLNRFDNGEKNG